MWILFIFYACSVGCCLAVALKFERMNQKLKDDAGMYKNGYEVIKLAFEKVKSQLDDGKVVQIPQDIYYVLSTLDQHDLKYAMGCITSHIRELKTMADAESAIAVYMRMKAIVDTLKLKADFDANNIASMIRSGSIHVYRHDQKHTAEPNKTLIKGS